MSKQQYARDCTFVSLQWLSGPKQCNTTMSQFTLIYQDTLKLQIFMFLINQKLLKGLINFRTVEYIDAPYQYHINKLFYVFLAPL